MVKYHCTVADPQNQFVKLIGDYSGQTSSEPANDAVAATAVTPADSVRDKLRIPKPHQLLSKKLKKDKEKMDGTATPATVPSNLPEEAEKEEEEDGLFPLIKVYAVTSGVNHILKGLKGHDEKERYVLLV